MNSAVHALEAKTQVKNYWIIRLLDGDECGLSYLAEDMNTDKEVVLYEFFPQDLVSRGDNKHLLLKPAIDEKEYTWRIESIVRDVKRLIPLNHPSLLKTIRSFSENGTIYCVSEYKEAQTLKEYLISKGGRLNENEIQKIMLPLVDVLHEMDRLNIVHKNINLKTIFIDKNATVTLGSFGLGVCNRLKNQDTCAFIPIEQCLMEERLGSASDMYAFGAVLYTLATGQKPIDAKLRNEAVKRGEYDPLVPIKASASYSEALCISINHALQLNSSKRAKSVTQLSGEYKKELSKVDPLEVQKIQRNKDTLKGLSRSFVRISVAMFVGVIFLYMIVEKEKPEGAPDLFEAVERSVAANEMLDTELHESKNSREATRMAYAYAVGQGVEQDPKKAFEWNLKAAGQGDEYAMFNLALAYLQGKGTSKDESEAFRWFSAAAKSDLAEAYAQLGLCYAKGTGTPKDDEKAIESYMKAIEMGYNYAYSGLGWFYENNHDYAKAMEAYKQVKGHGQGWAEGQIATFYQNGNGVSQNYFDAMVWYKKAAEHDNAYAMNQIGWMYEVGKSSISQSYSSAFYWYEKAANKGHATAQANLAQMYETGRGVQKNIPIAREWYQSAAKKGNGWAKKRLSNLANIH